MTARPPGPPGAELHRLCVFDLSLSCGHLVTLAVDGWYPEVVACCDRLGATILRGDYQPFASHVEYARLLSEQYEQLPKGTPREPSRLLDRRSRTDDPYRPRHGRGSPAPDDTRPGSAPRGTSTAPSR